MTYCESTVIVKGDTREKKAVTLKCHAWTCENCYPRRKAGLIAQAHRGRPNTFLTLTVRRHQVPTPNEAAAAIANAWRIVRKRLLRAEKLGTKIHSTKARPKGAPGQTDRYGVWSRPIIRPCGLGLEFMAVLEAHQSGWPHLHILTRSYWIDAEWLSEAMRGLLNSHHVDVQRITKKHRVASYVAAYCGKAAHKFGTSKRYWHSKRYELVKPKPKDENDRFTIRWERDDQSLDNWCAMWRTFEWHVERPEKDVAIARAPP